MGCSPRQLGGRVMSRRGASTTHVLLGSGVARASVPHRLLAPFAARDATSMSKNIDAIGDEDLGPTNKGEAAEPDGPSKSKAKRSTRATVPVSVPAEVVVLDEGWLLRHVRAAAVAAVSANASVMGAAALN
jgi:hypothetical protein